VEQGINGVEGIQLTRESDQVCFLNLLLLQVAGARAECGGPHRSLEGSHLDKGGKGGGGGRES
jgi:hypothetical protein